jgi:hypothetical protein
MPTTVKEMAEALRNGTIRLEPLAPSSELLELVAKQLEIDSIEIVAPRADIERSEGRAGYRPTTIYPRTAGWAFLLGREGVWMWTPAQPKTLTFFPHARVHAVHFVEPEWA